MLIVTVLVALALLGAGGVLQVRRTRRAVSAVGALLVDRDRSRRLLGVERAEQEGVALHAAALSRAARRERDPVVADAIAAAVRRALWEPTQSPEVVALRRWAADRPIATDRDPSRVVAVTPGAILRAAAASGQAVEPAPAALHTAAPAPAPAPAPVAPVPVAPAPAYVPSPAHLTTVVHRTEPAGYDDGLPTQADTPTQRPVGELVRSILGEPLLRLRLQCADDLLGAGDAGVARHGGATR